jgi:hypothetical protein
MNDHLASLTSILLGIWLLFTAGCDDNRNESPADRTKADTSFVRDSTWYASLLMNPARLQYGYSSPVELIDSLLQAVAVRDTATLADLAVSSTEWKEILFPEMGLHYPGARDSRPEIRDMIGELHFGSSQKGLRRLLRDYGGVRLRRLSMDMIGDTLHFPSYTIYDGTDLVVNGPDGEGRVTFVGSIVEKDGVWKLLSYRETDASGTITPNGD